MDNKGLFLLLFACFFIGTLKAAEPTKSELIEKLQQATTKGAQEVKDKSPNSESGRYTQSIPLWIESLRQAIKRSDINSLQQTLTQIRALFPSPEIEQLSNALIDSLQKEITEKEKSFIEKVDSTSDQAVKTAFAAKEAKELDTFILDLSRMSQRSNEGGGSEASRRASEKARSPTDPHFNALGTMK